MDTLTPQELRDARRRFEQLLAQSTSECEFQRLFTECPYILSLGLPLRLEPSEIQPLGRPGKAEPDFIFYPRTLSPVPSFGVIELKRPGTKLVTKPRKDLIILSRDASTAVAQAQNYARQLRRLMSSSFKTNLIIGNKSYVFVIAGLTEDLATKVLTGRLLMDLDGLVPPGCQIIPFDTLFERYASGIPPLTMILTPFRKSIIPSMDELLEKVEEGEKSRLAINDENMAFWIEIDNEWRGGKYIGTKRNRIIDRQYWCVTGTDILATESPAHLEFPAYVRHLINAIRSSARMHETLDYAEEHGFRLDELKKSLTQRQYTILKEAVERCRKSEVRSTWLYPIDEDVEFLERLGTIRFCNVDAGEFYYLIDPLVFELVR